MASSPWSQSPAAVPPDRPGVAAYDLRPLTLGEILDRTFSVYRSRFWLFAGICSSAALVQLILSGVQLVMVHSLRLRLTVTGLRTANVLMSAGVGIVVFLLFCVLQVATVHALSELYLGRTASLSGSLRAVGGRWLRYIGIGIWQMMSFGGIAAVFLIPAYTLLFRSRGTDVGLVMIAGLLMFLGFAGGGAVGTILYLRNALAVPASVVEGLDVRASMRRSKVLTPGAKGRLFVVMLIAGALYLVAGVMEAPLSIVVLQATLHHREALGTQAIMLLVQFVSSSVVPPVTLIGFSLIYFDQRVRKEALDLELMLGEGAAAVAEPEAEPELWTPAPRPGFITASAEQHAPSETIYAALVSQPPASAAGSPLPEATGHELPSAGPDDAQGA
jgi:hypothetical protein